MSTLVIYHGGCTDGVAAAYVASMSLIRDTVFHPGVHGEPPPLERIEQYDTLLFLDFSYNAADTLRCREALDSGIKARNSWMGIIDHHQSAIDRLTPHKDLFEEFTLDLSACGALLTWRHFHGQTPPPPLLEYIDRHDRHDFTDAPHDQQEVILALRSHPHAPRVHTTQAWAQLMARWEFLMSPEGTNKLREEGVPLKRYYKARVSEYIGMANRWQMIYRDPDGKPVSHDVMLTNMPYNFFTDVGTRLAMKNSVGGGWHVHNNKFTLSLRSCNGAARQIAEGFGGGGHDDAAGAVIPVECVNFAERIINYNPAR